MMLPPHLRDTLHVAIALFTLLLVGAVARMGLLHQPAWEQGVVLGLVVVVWVGLAWLGMRLVEGTGPRQAP